MTNRFTKFLLLGASPAMLLLLAQTNFANAQAITGGLHAQVVGNGGAPVANAEVKVVSEATGTTLNATTDSNGSITLSSLSVQSEYTVTVTAPGYSPKTVSHVGLTLGTATNLPVDLAEVKTETVTVTGQRVAAAAITESAGVATSFSALQIKNTPTVERDIRDIVQNTPYAYIDPVGGGSSPPVPTVNIAGANPRCNNFLVDGLQQKDTFGLNFSGYPTTRAPIPTDWAAQVQVAVTPYDVQYNDTCGGVVNVVTKSGTNEFHGTVYGYMKNDGLNGQDFNLFNNNTGLSTPTNATNRPIKPYFDEKSYGGTLAGPIIPDTLFFFVGYDEIKRTQSNSGTAVGPNGLGFTTTATTISAAEVNQIVADAKNVYGFNAGNLTDPNAEYNQRYIGKLTWQINDDHSLTGIYQHVAGATLSINNGTASSSAPRVTLPSNWYENAQKMEVYNLQESSHWSDSLTTELSIGHQSVHEIPTPVDGLNFPEVYVRTPGGDGALGTSDDGYVRLGPDFSRQYNFLYDSNNYVKALANYTLDEHNFEGGFEFHELHVDDKFVQGAQGVVRFDSEAAFAARQISTQILTASNGINASTSNAAGNPIYFATGVGGNPAAADGVFSYSVSSVFLQDTWYPIKDLTVLAGIRYDRYGTNTHGIVANPYFAQRYGFSNTLTLDGLDAVLPRVSVVYNVTPDQDFVPDTLITLRGGVGMFSGGFQNVWVTNDYDTNGINLLNVTGIPGQGTFASVSSIMPVDHAAFVQSLVTGPLSSATTIKTSSVDAQLPNFKLPETLKMNLGFDTYFGDGFLGPNWQFTFDYLNANAYDSAYWTNLRLTKTSGTAPDGRALYSLKFDGTINKDPANPAAALTGSDYGLGSADGGNSTLFIGTIKNSWKDTGFGDFTVSLSYAHERTTDIQAGTSSTASSNYNNIDRINFNDPEVGRSDYEREHRATVNINIVEKFFGDLETRFNIFGQRLSGQHYSLNFNPTGNPFIVNPSTGLNAGIASGARSLLYIPKTDPTTGLVTATSDPLVNFVAGFDFASFNAVLKEAGALKYAGKIAPRNAFSGPWSSLVNLSVEQELAGFDDTHRLVFMGDIYNVLNLLNPAWGATTSAVFYQADPVVNATIVGGKYLYSTPQTLSGFNGFTFQTQRASSTYQIQFGVRYEF